MLGGPLSASILASRVSQSRWGIQPRPGPVFGDVSYLGMLLAVSLSDDRLKFSLHLFFGEVECPLGSAACLLKPSLVRLAFLCPVGSFQPRFEIGVHAHWRFFSRTVGRIRMSTNPVAPARAIIRRRRRPLPSRRTVCLNFGFVRHGGYRAPALRIRSAGVSGGNSSSQGSRFPGVTSHRVAVVARLSPRWPA